MCLGESNLPLVLDFSVSMPGLDGKKKDGEEGVREGGQENDEQDKESPQALTQLCKHSSDANTSHKLYSNSNASLLNLRSSLTLASLHPVAVGREGVVFNYPCLSGRVLRPWPPRLNFQCITEGALCDM